MNRFNIDFEKELNSDQFVAVTSPVDRPALVLAGAGSGKTRTLTYRVAWLISECDINPWEVLLVTFTNKAAAQMLERISQLTGIESNRFWSGTFHSLGNRFLRIDGEKIGLNTNFSILDMEDADALLKEATKDIYPNFFSSKDNPRPKLLREIISYARNTCQSVASAMMERFDWLETPYEKIQNIAESYEEKKRDKNLCDFDDLLELWYKLLIECPEVLSKYNQRFKNILVDEYQDTNLLQSKILDLLADRGQITAVGDDAQCIYSWRGAEIDNILNFKDRFPSAYIYKISRNYRSTPEILNFANAVLENMPSSEDYRKELVAARPSDRKPILIRALDGVSQGRQIADLIRDIAESGRYGYGDIAVLYRSHFQAMDLQMQLQYKKVPFIMASGVKFFEQAHIKDIIAQIKFVKNPKDSVSFGRFMRFMPKVGEKTALKIFFAAQNLAAKEKISIADALASKGVTAKVPTAAKELYSELVRDFKKIELMIATIESRDEISIFDINKQPVKSANEDVETGISSKIKAQNASSKSAAAQSDFFAQMFGEPPASPEIIAPKPIEKNPQDDIEISANCKIKDLIIAACSGWYKDAMKTIYEDFQERAGDFDALCEYASRYDNFEQFLANVTLEISEAEASTSADDIEHSAAENVRLMTVHQAKGLEFPVVFIIGAADGLFPTKRSIDGGDTDEEQRLFYVAATRAKDALIISYPSVSTSNGDYERREQSRFLSDVDASLYDAL